MKVYLPRHRSDGAGDSWWVALPFVEQAFVLALFAALGPGVYGLHLIHARRYAFGAAVLAVWLAAFLAFAAWLADRRTVRPAISIGGMLFVMILAACVIWD